MTPAMEALARRAVAAKVWRRLPGMRATPRRNDTQWRPIQVATDDDFGGVANAPDGWLPDLGDAATLGCLLALVRKAWHAPGLYVRQRTTYRTTHDDSGPVWWWFVYGVDAPDKQLVIHEDEDTINYAGGPTEAEALVAALEAVQR